MSGITRASGRKAQMATVPSPESIDAVPTYLGGGDPDRRFTDYYPAWLDNLADDATLEGSLLDGAVQGADAVRTMLRTVRELYDRQTFTFVGPWGDNGFIEDYTAEVAGAPIGSLVLITTNAAGQTQHIAVGYRPRSSLLLMSRLAGEKLAGTPYASYFLTEERDKPIDQRRATS
jgi:hypothetical protein